MDSLIDTVQLNLGVFDLVLVLLELSDGSILYYLADEENLNDLRSLEDYPIVSYSLKGITVPPTFEFRY